MIAKNYRFHGQKGINYVYRRGQTIRTKYIAVKFTVNPKNTNYRASVVISKKVAKSAPMRNRVRRRLYEQIRLLAPKYLYNQDIVITVFDQELAVLPANEIEQLMARTLKSIAQMSKQRQ